MADDIDHAKLSQFGFAKLLGMRGDEPVEYIIRKYEVILGRNSKNSTADVVLGVFPLLLRKGNSTCGMFMAPASYTHDA